MERRDAVLALLTFLLGAGIASPALNYGWNRFPSGADARGHMTKVWMLERLWSLGDRPYPPWSDYWYCGYPFLWYYPPLSYFVPALMSRATGADVLTAWKVWTVLAYALAGPTVYATARLFGAGPASAFLAAFLYQTSYNHLEITFTEGRIPTVAAVALYALVPGLLVALYDPRRDRRRLAGLLAPLLALTLLTHHSTGLAALALCLAYALLRLLHATAQALRGRLAVPDLLPDLPGHFWSLTAVALALMIAAWWLYPALHYRTYLYTTKPRWWVHMSSVHDPLDLFVPGYWKTRYAKYVGAAQFFLGWAGLLLAVRRRPRAFLPFASLLPLAVFLSFGLVLQREMEAIGFEPKWFLMFSTPVLCAFGGLAVERLRTAVSPRRLAPVLALLCCGCLCDAALGLYHADRPVHYTRSELAALLWVKGHAGPWDRVAVVGYRAMWGMSPYLTGRPAVFGWFREGTTIRDVIVQYQRSFKRREVHRALFIGRVLGIRYLVLSARKPYARECMRELRRLGLRPVRDYRWVRVYEFRVPMGYELDGVKSVFLGNKYRYMRLCRLARFDPRVVPAYAFTRSVRCRLVREARPEVVVMDRAPTPEQVRELRRLGVRRVLVMTCGPGRVETVEGVPVRYLRPMEIVRELPRRHLRPVAVRLGHARVWVGGRGLVWVKVPYFPCWLPVRGERLGGIDNMLLLRTPGPTVVAFRWRPSGWVWSVSVVGLGASLLLVVRRRSGFRSF
ncbi:6-pyruvoyl-tetrahydropterin synthase-related protein [Methanopyrus sp.]